MTLPIQDVLLLTLVMGAMAALVARDLVSFIAQRRTRPAAARPQAVAAEVVRRVRAAPQVLPQAADVLLVDDSAVARAKLRRLFEAAGYRVHLACDGVEALALLGKGGYRMMVTDLEMPNMDGTALINACQRQPATARMPVIAISAHDNLRARFNECRDISGVHRKPWVDDILLSHVATLVGTPVRQPMPCPA